MGVGHGSFRFPIESLKYSLVGDAPGLPLKFEDDGSAAFGLGNTIVNLLVAVAAPELIEPAAVAPPDSGVRAQLTLTVDGVDTTYQELLERGVTFLNGPIDRPWGVRTTCFPDLAHPSGHPEVRGMLRTR